MGKSYDHGYQTEWQDLLVYRREGFVTSVADYHSHDYYEINLIFSGNIRILLADEGLETAASQVVLIPPGARHYIACKPDTLYSRLYLCFSGAFLADDPRWERLRQVFGQRGRILPVSRQRREQCTAIIEGIHGESEPLRRQLLVLYLLSWLEEYGREQEAANPVPSYVTEALAHIQEHYPRRLVAAQLARSLHVSRTTLMTGFKTHTGMSLGHYLVRFRLRRALERLRGGETVQAAAEGCGFGDSGSLIRSFRRVYGTTPARYLRDEGT